MVTLMMDTDNCSLKSYQKMPFCHISTKGLGMLKDHFPPIQNTVILVYFFFIMSCGELNWCFKLIFQLFFSSGQKC